MLAEREMLRPREGTTRGHWQCPRLKRLKTLAIDGDNEISRGTEMSPFVGGDIGRDKKLAPMSPWSFRESRLSRERHNI